MGDVAIYIRGALAFAPLTERHIDPADDSTEVCGVHILGSAFPIDIINLYRPPIRNTEGDDRVDPSTPGRSPQARTSSS